MKAIMVLFDSLNRRYLPPYGFPEGEGVIAPNFERLARHSVRFERSYAGSLPCMPARRELHTGRLNFLHRGWGPLEPFDDSMPELLSQAGVYTHLISDHLHYWADGGATYHTRYNSWEQVRGQQGDRWKASVREPEMPEHLGQQRRQDQVNRHYLQEEADHPLTRVFDLGLEFLEKNRDADQWFLQIEAFDPHEPFTVPQRYLDMYPHQYDGPAFDWPPYAPETEGEAALEHARCRYKALLSMCDHQLGRLLDKMDEQGLWEDTLLIVNTDHGFMLGEQGWWAKMRQPHYEEISHTPLFIWDPRSSQAGVARDALVQTIDLAPTMLDFFGLRPTPDMQGKVLKDTIARDRPVREALLFGHHGGQVGVTDGRYVYLRGPAGPGVPAYEYTLMPTRMNSRFSVEDMRSMVTAPPFRFTKGCPLMRIGRAAPGGESEIVRQYRAHPEAERMLRMLGEARATLLYDLEADPRQAQPIRDAVQEARLTALLRELMQENDAPEEQYRRVGLDA